MVKLPLDVGTNSEEDIIQESQPDTAVEDEGEYEEEGDGDGDNEDELESLDGLDYNPMVHLSQMFVSESGAPIADILESILTALKTQNKILHKLVHVVEAKNDDIKEARK